MKINVSKTEISCVMSLDYVQLQSYSSKYTVTAVQAVDNRQLIISVALGVGESVTTDQLETLKEEEQIEVPDLE